jgi:hypothetical protein
LSEATPQDDRRLEQALEELEAARLTFERVAGFAVPRFAGFAEG